MTTQQYNSGLDVDVLDERAELLITRNIRLSINKALMADGIVPTDPEKLDFLMKNLKDMDTSALARSRIKSDEKTANVTAGTIAMVTEVFQSLRGGKQLPPDDITDVQDARERAPMLPDELANHAFVPGENQIGNIQEDIDSFKNRMNN